MCFLKFISILQGDISQPFALMNKLSNCDYRAMKKSGSNLYGMEMSEWPRSIFKKLLRKFQCQLPNNVYGESTPYDILGRGAGNMEELQLIIYVKKIKSPRM